MQGLCDASASEPQLIDFFRVLTRLPIKPDVLSSSGLGTAIRSRCLDQNRSKDVKAAAHKVLQAWEAIAAATSIKSAAPKQLDKINLHFGKAPAVLATKGEGGGGGRATPPAAVFAPSKSGSTSAGTVAAFANPVGGQARPALSFLDIPLHESDHVGLALRQEIIAADEASAAATVDAAAIAQKRAELHQQSQATAKVELPTISTFAEFSRTAARGGGSGSRGGGAAAAAAGGGGGEKRREKEKEGHKHGEPRSSKPSSGSKHTAAPPSSSAGGSSKDAHRPSSAGSRRDSTSTSTDPPHHRSGSSRPSSSSAAPDNNGATTAAGGAGAAAEAES
ncbi:MAG: hypothetical protein WDW38_005538 [Sanguina aurantia]